MDVLAIDAGGTSTRAVHLDAAGRAHGYGRAPGGNPTSAGIGSAVEAIGAAAAQALAGAPGEDVALALVAMAGEQTDAFVRALSARLGALGLARVLPHHDLLAVFHSGTPSLDGYALVAGTGSVAARVRGGVLERVVGGRGWLLGDAGSGFWIGHRVVRAVVATLDGQAADTALTRPVLAALGIDADPSEAGGRLDALSRLVSAAYAQPPVRLAALAPLAFAAYPDPLAVQVLTGAADALAALLDTVHAPDLVGPVVGGGSVLAQGFLPGPEALRSRLRLAGREVVTVPDGLVGSAVLALREVGVVVEGPLFDVVRAEVTRVATPRR